MSCVLSYNKVIQVQSEDRSLQICSFALFLSVLFQMQFSSFSLYPSYSFTLSFSCSLPLLFSCTFLPFHYVRPRSLTLSLSLNFSLFFYFFSSHFFPLPQVHTLSLWSSPISSFLYFLYSFPLSPLSSTFLLLLFILLPESFSHSHFLPFY